MYLCGSLARSVDSTPCREIVKREAETCWYCLDYIRMCKEHDDLCTECGHPNREHSEEWEVCYHGAVGNRIPCNCYNNTSR